MKSQTYDALVIPFVLSDPIPVSGLKKTGNLIKKVYATVQEESGMYAQLSSLKPKF